MDCKDPSPSYQSNIKSCYITSQKPLWYVCNCRHHSMFLLFFGFSLSSICWNTLPHPHTEHKKQNKEKQAHQSSFCQAWSQHGTGVGNKYVDWLISTKWEADWFISMLIRAEGPLLLWNRAPDEDFSLDSSQLHDWINMYHLGLMKTFLTVITTDYQDISIKPHFCSK